MNAHQQALAQAQMHQRAGAVAQAEALCLQILGEDAKQAEAWNLLGILAFQTGRVDFALERFERAVESAPASASYRSNRGAILQTIGRFGEAEREFREALRLNPSHVDAHSNLGTVLRNLGRFDESIASYRESLRLRPDNVEVMNNLAAALADLGQGDAAVSLLRRVLELKPGYAEALYNLGNILARLRRSEEALWPLRRALELMPNYVEAANSLGVVLHDLERFGEAEVCYRRALELRPGASEIHNRLGSVLRHLGRFPEAEACYRRAIELAPNIPEPHNNLGNILWMQNRAAEAEGALRRALELRPVFPEAHTNLGHVVRELGRLDEAEACYRQALAQKPNYPEAHSYLGILQLLRGDYARGWAEYEWRTRVRGFVLPAYPQPLWDGGPLENRTILLHAEQGLGDTIQFVRYAPLLKQRGAKVLLHCPRALLDLMGSCPGVDRVIPAHVDPPPFDVRAPLLNLPRLCGTTADTIPAAVPYLTPDPGITARWNGLLTAMPGFKVGIVWRGSVTFRGDHFRSVALSTFLPLSRVAGVRLVSLQVPGSLEFGVWSSELKDHQWVTDLGGQFDRESFNDVAAVVKNLDLVISVDTAIAHLAGALARPVWVALPFAPDWRWLLDREDTSWYPTMRLFRQRRSGDWAEVFERMARELERSR